MKKILLLLLILGIGFRSFALDENDADKGIITGTVRTSDNKLAEGVLIHLIGTNKNVITDENGGYIFRNVIAGHYTIEATLVGYSAYKREIDVVQKAKIVVDFNLSISEMELSTVIVNATKNKYASGKENYVAKMPLKNLENPQVYSTLNHQLINDQMVYSVDDAMKTATGVQMMWQASGRGGDGGAYYNSRGFIMQSQLRNGVAGNVTSRIDAANIESIEIIKGPSATLYGSTLTSYGGLINRVTKKPYDHFGGEVAISSGSFGFNRISADMNTPLDSAKKVLLRVNTAYNHEGSFQDNGFNRSFIFAPSLSYEVNDKLSFLLDAEISQGQSTGMPVFFFYHPISQLGADRADQLGLDYKRSYFSNDLTQTSRSNNLFGLMKYKIADKWLSQTNFSSSYSFSNGRSPYFFLIPDSSVTHNPADANKSNYLSRGDQSTANSEITVTELQQNFNGEFKIGQMRNRVLLGLDYFRQNSNQLFYSTDGIDTIRKNGVIPNYADFNENKVDAYYQNTPSSQISTYPIKFISNTYSAYVSDVVDIRNNLFASAAVRFDYFDNQGNFDPTTGSYAGGYHQSAFSPKFGLVYQPLIDRISLFANYQNGFTNKTGVDYLNHPFKPEQANQIEGGVKLSTIDAKLSGTFTYYHIKVDNVVRAYTGDPSNPQAQIQDGTQLSKGLEAEVIANPFDGFNIDAGFSYNDSKYVKADADVIGRRSAYAMSPYSADLWMGYKVPRGKLTGLGFGFGGNYASDNKVVNSSSMGVFILPAYTVLNATTYYETKKFKIGIKVGNLTNKQYWIGYGTMNPQALRSVTGSIVLKF